MEYAGQRRLYGRTLAELPKSRRELAESTVDVLTHEALALVASRAVHTAPQELSLSAAVTKYLVPTGTEAVIGQLTRLLGARAFLKGCTPTAASRRSTATTGSSASSTGTPWSTSTPWWVSSVR
ncbi:acyl-CoA dehydrogenase family protein [Streptacidiphilus monticola]